MPLHLPFLLQLHYHIFLNWFQGKGVRKIKFGKFEFKKKEKHEPDKIPVHRKKVKMKSARIIVLIAMIFIFSSGILAWIKACVVQQQNEKLQKQINTYQKKLDNASTGISAYSPLLDHYMQDFLGIYMNIPNNTDEMKKRNKELKSYLAPNLNGTIRVSDDSQTLENATLYSVFTKNGVKIAQYQVDYTQHTKDKKDYEHSSFLNIPFKEKNHQFTVVDYPYFTKPVNPVGHVGQLKTNYSSQQNNHTKTVRAVSDFTKSFLDKYASSSPQEMSFLMAKPEGLNGQFKVVKVENLTVYGTRENPVVQCLITLQNSNTDIRQLENVTLKLHQQSRTYFVDEFIHDQGGNTDE